MRLKQQVPDLFNQLRHIKLTQVTLPILYSALVIIFICSRLAMATEKSNWLDNTHANISNSLNASAMWFDDFFEHPDYAKEANAKARLRVGYLPNNRTFGEFEQKFRVSAKLPNLEDRWELIFSDYDEASENTTSREIINDIENNNRGDFNLALKFTQFLDDNQYITSRIGLRRADVYLRSQYKRDFKLTTDISTVLNPSIYYYFQSGWLYRLQHSINWQLSQDDSVFWQLNNTWEHEVKIEESSWRHSMLRYQKLNEKTAMIAGAFYTGLIDQGYVLQNKGVFFRYRQQAIRHWFFFEIEPYIQYPLEYDFERNVGLALRVELNFGQSPKNGKSHLN